ncbi:MAG: hypothetical protein KDD43_13915, partial [Bdellovibrionales bacterium]|nr:hypothetical protein [Bdellovibrionales bacterium]
MEKSYIQSPLGWLKLTVDEERVYSIDRVRSRGVQTARISPLMLQLQNQLKEYFGGKRHKFDLPLADRG